MSKIVIDLAAEFTGKGAFKQADTATQKLTKNVKKLAGAVGIAYGASAIIAYGKASVKAFAADEAAALRLSRAVTNLGIGFANPAIADYIAKLEKSSAIADDILRPAFQSLLTTTGSLTKSQELLNNAITISRGSGVDLATVTEDLAKGYVGITKGLTKYNTGLTKAELTSKSFSEILGVLLKRSAGAAEDYLGSTSYAVDVLSIATGNASEIIGGGLVDALARLAGGTEASDAATAIEGIATAIANVERAIGVTLGAIPSLIRNLKNLPAQIFSGFAGKAAGVNINVVAKKKENKLTLTQVQQQEALARLQAAAAKREKELLALKNKQNQAAKLKMAIDKANLALGKGGNVFDMDAIQLNAAMINQAEQLGKATSAAQVLAITNDIARLRVKQDILDLEKAIASGDEAAITAATKKLNEDLKILGTLQQQSIKLLDIKSILDGLLPKDLINLQNLKDAIALLAQIGTPNLTQPAGSSAFAPTPSSVAAAIAGRAGTGISGATDPRVAYGGQRIDSGGNYVSYNPEMAAALSAAAGRAAGNSRVEVTVVAPPFTDPNAIATSLRQVIQDAVDRGTLRGGSY
jgi:hypothetical protein